MIVIVAVSVARVFADDPNGAPGLVPPAVNPPPASEEVETAESAKWLVTLRGIEGARAPTSESLETAARLLEHDSARVRNAAVAALRAHRTDAARLVQDLLHHPDSQSRRRGLLAIQALGDAGLPFVIDVLTLAMDPSTAVRNAASFALSKLAPLPAATCTRVAAELDGRDAAWCSRALEVLAVSVPTSGTEGTWTDSALVWVAKSLKAPSTLHADGQLAFLGACSRLRGVGERADDLLVSMLREADLWMRRRILLELGGTGRPLSEANTRALLDLLDDAQLQDAATDTLARRLGWSYLAPRLLRSSRPSEQRSALLAMPMDALARIIHEV